MNAESGDVTHVEGTDPIYAFLTQSEVEEIQNRIGGQKGGMTVKVVVTNADGQIVGTRNITVPEGGGIEMNVQDEENNSTATQPG